jgi:hypothetical protein
MCIAGGPALLYILIKMKLYRLSLAMILHVFYQFLITFDSAGTEEAVCNLLAIF